MKICPKCGTQLSLIYDAPYGMEQCIIEGSEREVCKRCGYTRYLTKKDKSVNVT